MKVCSRVQMQTIDKMAIEDFGIPGLILMENAGIKSALKLMELFPDIRDKLVFILAGGGNNGGDGLVIARQLYNQGIRVKVYLMGEGPKSADAMTNLRIVQRLGIEIHHLSFSSEIKGLRDGLLKADIVIDAILGTGATGEIKGITAEVIELLNEVKRLVIAIDIPSGLDSDTGKPLGACVRASYTFTLGLSKIGLLTYPGREWAGELILLDISLPPSLLTDAAIKTNLLLAQDLAKFLPSHPSTAYKGQCGRVAVLAGSVGMTGAASLTSQAALAIGAGLVSLGLPESLNDIVEAKLTEVITVPLPETKERSLSTQAYDQAMLLASKAEAMAIGPGLSRHNETSHLVRELVSQISTPMVVDADAIFALSEDKSVFSKVKAPIIMTPHPGEMANFLGINIYEVQTNRLAIARQVAQEYKITLVLKGAATVIASPQGEAYLNTTGNSGLATAGTGDVLTGMIAGLLAQGLSSVDASCLGVFLHGLSGDIAAKHKGALSLLASDLIAKMPEAIKELKSYGK